MIQRGDRSSREAGASFPSGRRSSLADRRSSLPDRRSSFPDRGSFLPDRGSSLPDRGSFLSDRGSFLSDRGSTLPDRGSSLSLSTKNRSGRSSPGKDDRSFLSLSTKNISLSTENRSGRRSFLSLSRSNLPLSRSFLASRRSSLSDGGSPVASRPASRAPTAERRAPADAHTSIRRGVVPRRRTGSPGRPLRATEGAPPRWPFGRRRSVGCRAFQGVVHLSRVQPRKPSPERQTSCSGHETTTRSSAQRTSMRAQATRGAARRAVVSNQDGVSVRATLSTSGIAENRALCARAGWPADCYAKTGWGIRLTPHARAFRRRTDAQDPHHEGGNPWRP